MENEIWKDIPNYEGLYQVSNLGNVKSLEKIIRSPRNPNKFQTNKERILKPGNIQGYRNVILSNICKKTISVHRLVCLSFIPNIENKPQINHINGVKHDNRVENLEWCTLSENRIHAYRTGLQKGALGEKSSKSKLTENEVLEIRKNKFNLSREQLSKKYNVGKPCISEIINYKKWKHLK